MENQRSYTFIMFVHTIGDIVVTCKLVIIRLDDYFLPPKVVSIRKVSICMYYGINAIPIVDVFIWLLETPKVHTALLVSVKSLIYAVKEPFFFPLTLVTVEVCSLFTDMEFVCRIFIGYLYFCYFTRLFIEQIITDHGHEVHEPHTYRKNKKCIWICIQETVRLCYRICATLTLYWTGNLIISVTKKLNTLCTFASISVLGGKSFIICGKCTSIKGIG